MEFLAIHLWQGSARQREGLSPASFRNSKKCFLFIYFYFYFEPLGSANETRLKGSGEKLERKDIVVVVADVVAQTEGGEGREERESGRKWGRERGGGEGVIERQSSHG